MHRVLRCIICFLLICSLLVNFLPTRAEAISTGVAVSAGIVAGAIIYGLGVSIGDHPDEFNSLVAEAITAMQTAGVVVTNGLIDVMSLGSGLFGVKSDAIQSLFDWLHSDSGAVLRRLPGAKYYAANEPVYTTSSIYSTYDQPTYQFYYDAYSGGDYVITVCATAGVTMKCKVPSGSSYVFNPSSYTHAVSMESSGYDQSFLTSIGVPTVSYQDYDSIGKAIRAFINAGFPGESTIYTESDLSLNFVAQPGISIATGYPLWHENSVTIPNAETGEDETYYPIALGNSMEETQSFTQEQVWAGAGTYVDSELVPGTGDGTITVPDNATLKDILAGVLSIPHAIATGIEKVVVAVVALPAAIVDGLRNPKPPDDHNNFALADLKNFFPFCIPFDLYAFFQLLNAEPVAPVLSWELQDLAGQTYSLSVDLAEWDSVAQLFRRLQLFLFITGLAAASRKFIKW